MLSTEQNRIVFRAQRMMNGGEQKELNELLDQITDPEARDSLINEALAFNNFSAVLLLVSESTGHDQLSRVFKKASDCKACNVISGLCKRGFLKQEILQYQGALKASLVDKKLALSKTGDQNLRIKLECEIALTTEQVIPDSGLLLIFLQNAFEVATGDDIIRYNNLARTILEKQKDESLSVSIEALDKYYKESNVSVQNQLVKDEFFSDYEFSKSRCILS